MAPSRRAQLVEWIRHSLASKAQILPFPAPAQRISLYFACATLLFFLGYYTDLGIGVGQGSSVPMVSAMPGFAMLLFYPGILSPRLARFIVVPMIFVLAMSILAPQFGALLLNRLLGVGQTGFSVTMGYVASWVIARCGRARVHNFLSIAIPVFLLLAAVEIALPPMRTLMQAWMDLYGTDVNFDALSDRDLSMGGYRPTLFTSETSYVATAAMLMLVCYVWTGIGVKRYVLAAIYLILAAGLIRSPIVVIALPVIFVGVFTDQTLGRFRSLYAFWMTIIAIFAVSLIAVLAVSVIAERLDNIATGQDYSTTYRTYGAIAVAIAVLHKYPLFGAGVGSLKPVKDIIMSTYISLGVPVEAAELNWNQSINNTYASVLVYLGLVGAVLVVMGLWRLIKTDVLRNKLPVVLALLGFFWTSGAIYTPKYVITICTILTVAKLRPVLGKIPTAVRQRRPGLLSRGDPRLNAPRSGPLPGLRENPAPQTPV